MTEKEMCSVLKSILQKECNVSGEVPCGSGYIDLVAWRDNPLYTISYETKLSVSTAGVVQAIRRKYDANKSWLVTLKKPNDDWETICQSCGIGLAYVVIAQEPLLSIVHEAKRSVSQFLKIGTLRDHLSIVGGGVPGEITEWKIKCSMIWLSLSDWKTLKELKEVNPFKTLAGLRDLLINSYPFKYNVSVDRKKREYRYRMSPYMPFPWGEPMRIARERMGLPIDAETRKPESTND